MSELENMTGVASQNNVLEKSALEGWSASGVENIGIYSAELPLASEPVAVAQEWSHSTVSSKVSEQTASDEERAEIGGVASSGGVRRGIQRRRGPPAARLRAP